MYFTFFSDAHHGVLGQIIHAVVELVETMRTKIGEEGAYMQQED